MRVSPIFAISGRFIRPSLCYTINDDTCTLHDAHLILELPQEAHAMMSFAAAMAGDEDDDSRENFLVIDLLAENDKSVTYGLSVFDVIIQNNETRARILRIYIYSIYIYTVLEKSQNAARATTLFHAFVSATLRFHTFDHFPQTV
jgi:hypothetical protein